MKIIKTLGFVAATVGVLIGDVTAKGVRFLQATTITQDETHDWVWDGHVLSPEDQGSCEADWAFALMTAIEGHYSINNNQGLHNFSEQFLIDCFGQFFADTDFCSATTEVEPQLALEYLIDTQSQIPKSWQYLYQGTQQECQILDEDIVNGQTVASYNTLIEPTLDETLEALSDGPLVARIIGDRSVIEAYQSGQTLQDCQDGDNETVEESIWVNIVGYHYKPWSGEQKFRVKFPWGPQWGDGGYAFVNAVSEDVDGICGLRQEIITVALN